MPLSDDDSNFSKTSESSSGEESTSISEEEHDEDGKREHSRIRKQSENSLRRTNRLLAFNELLNATGILVRAISMRAQKLNFLKGC